MLVLFDLAFIAFFFAIILTPVVRDAAKRWGLVDKPDLNRKLHTQPVPRIGGVAVALSALLACISIVILPYKNVPFDIEKALSGGLALLPAALVIFCTGLLDDLRGIKPWMKLLGQTIAAILAYYAGFGVHVLRGHPLEVMVSLPVTVIWLVGCSNAFNLIDGMDGLSAGIGLFATVTMMIAGLTQGHLELAMVTVPLAGSLLGFLRYNFNPASIFLGDCGSLWVGFLLGCFGASWSHKSATILGLTAPLMAMAIPLIDTGVAIIRRLLRGRPIFDGDHRHIHHRLLDMGLTPRKAALILYALCGLAAALSLLTEVTHDRVSGLIVVLFCGAAWVGIQHLGYAEFGWVGRLVFRGALSRLIDVQIRLQDFERDLNSQQSSAGLWTVLHKGSEEFGFQGVRARFMGQIYEQHSPQQGDKPRWQLRVPLPGSQYVNLYREMDSTMHPMVLSAFAEVAQRVLTERLGNELRMERIERVAVHSAVPDSMDLVTHSDQGD